jgi:4-hydroxyproline epimerase
METPAGLVTVSYTQSGSKVKSVKLVNVPAWLAATGLKAVCPVLGELNIDVSYGGNFYAIVDLQENFPGLEHFAAGQLIEWARALRDDINKKYSFIHPEDPTIHGCSHILWTGSVLDKKSTARNAVFYGDKAIDRSPCGTGTSARMAQWYAKGKLKKGDLFIHESIIGSTFTGTIEEETTVAGNPAIRPGIEGWARIYGYNTISIDDEDDPYAYGFQVL